MPSEFNESDFIDRDFQPSQQRGYSQAAGAAKAGDNRPPSREELDAKSVGVQQELAEIKQALEEKERQRAALEEARRRQIEFETGRHEVLQNLTRGIGLLEEAEFTARRDAEQIAKTLQDLREAQTKTESLQEDNWTQENYDTELTRALTTIENARMEWNSARVKWPVLSGPTSNGTEVKQPTPLNSQLTSLSFSELCRIGFGLTWPLALMILLALGTFVALLLRR
jgi:hypothetical protein